MNILNVTGASASNDSRGAIARLKLEEAVARGIQRATPTVERILSQQPADSLVTARSLSFELNERAQVSMRPADMPNALSLHSNAWGQLLGRFGVDKGYADSLLESGEAGQWKRDLATRILTEHATHSRDRYLVRSMGSEARGILSSRFRRLDSRPLLDAFIKACQRVNAVPYEGVHTDTRSSVRAILPTVFEPVPGEFMVAGLAWTNSDFGVGSYGISAFLLRLVCLNGAVGESHIRERHIGGELPTEIELSARTMMLDTSKTVSLTEDIVRGYLGNGAENAFAVIQKANEQETTFEGAWKKFGRNLTKADKDAAKAAFEGEDTVMLPPGATNLRFSNALSWIANNVESTERKLDLQRVAGAVLAA